MKQTRTPRLSPDLDFGRRDFLRLFTRMLGGTIAVTFLQACQKLGIGAAAELPTVAPTVVDDTPVPSLPAVSAPTPASPSASTGKARIAFVKTRDRLAGVQRALALLGENPVHGKSVLLKPNLNSADPAPASTHPETLRALAQSLQGMGARSITVADRSGMGQTRRVMERLGVYALGSELGFDVLVFDELGDPVDWRLIHNAGDHWENGFPLPRVLLEAEAIVQTCCLKPHRFGGHFTLSLKNSVGMVGAFMGRGGHNYMTELHNSPHQRLMIAEVNAAYTPALILLDGVEAFIDNGPDIGTRAWGEVMLAGTDRVAVDAVGLALLRSLGYTGVAADGPIFAQEQIARAVELGLGISRPEQIEFLTDDPDSAAYSARIQAQMLKSG